MMTDVKSEALRIDGKAAALAVRTKVSEEVAKLLAEHGTKPGLAVVLVGEDPASEIYVRSKAKATVEAGMASFEHRLPADIPAAGLLELVERLNADPKVHGILVQLPLPKHIDADLVIDAISPAKDVDGFHRLNAGALAVGHPAMVPCTPLGSYLMLRDHLGDLAGLHAVVVGRSNIVGKPMAQLLLQANCTVTIAHSRTRDLAGFCHSADILVAAVGRPEFIPGDWIKPGATIIDIGINRVMRDGKTKLVGDVDYASAVKVAGAITPVPGGVGPMTIACLLANTLNACCDSLSIPRPAGLGV